MANAKLLQPFILRWEGGFVNDPLDRGGATNKGITIGTFRQFYGKDATVEQLKNITDEQWLHIFKSGYWNPWKADEIVNQSIANIVVDWAWASGPGTSIKQVQGVLGVAADGIVGPKTLATINSADQRTLVRRHSCRPAEIRRKHRPARPYAGSIPQRMEKQNQRHQI